MCCLNLISTPQFLFHILSEENTHLTLKCTHFCPPYFLSKVNEYSEQVLNIIVKLLLNVRFNCT